MTEPNDKEQPLERSKFLLKNGGEPLGLTGVQLDGVCAEAASDGEKVKIWTRLSLTSDDRLFHRIVEGLVAHINYRAREAGHAIRLNKADLILLVIHTDNTGDLWIDTAAVSLQVTMKKSVSAGTPIFENDVADVTGMNFPLVHINETDRVVCIFREDWRFALFFDFNPDGSLSLHDMERDLGTLNRRLKYRDIYDAVADQSLFTRLVANGWFPFAEILGQEFRELAAHCEAGFELSDVEENILAKFPPDRVEHLFTRWMAKPHFAGKEKLLRSALMAFANKDPVSVIKIALTEIEGILADAYRQVYGKGAKLKRLLEFAIESAEQKTGQPDTLLFPVAFGYYLKSQTFANFDPRGPKASANSRHAVGHGAADPESYTMVRALQALLTLDQLAFYN